MTQTEHDVEQVGAGNAAEIARRFIEAIDARDVDGLRALATEDVEFRNRQGRSFHGYDGARDVVRAAEHSGLLLVATGRAQIDDGGSRLSLPVSVVLGRDRLTGTAEFRIRDGKVAAFEVVTEQ